MTEHTVIIKISESNGATTVSAHGRHRTHASACQSTLEIAKRIERTHGLQFTHFTQNVGIDRHAWSTFSSEEVTISIVVSKLGLAKDGGPADFVNQVLGVEQLCAIRAEKLSAALDARAAQ